MGILCSQGIVSLHPPNSLVSESSEMGSVCTAVICRKIKMQM
uniref:Uncharacterized protein n=1 Tax=Anguilla anguilla TaxID=7936 RepID=A0A0E9PMQ6_ANGAN